ncbi:MAG TPA: DinB family protein [Gemmatimonadales bacterium]|nr:DinB family protein [Gemmatimonadales bacterium]
MRTRMAKMPGMDLLVEFFRHNAMMNRRLVEACRQLRPEQLGATAIGTYGNIGATLVHIANAQEGYAARLLDTQRPERLPEDPFPGFEALAERFAHGDAQLEEAPTQAGQDREVRVTGDDPPGTWLMPVSLFLLQAVNHGTEHRSQVATILTQLGVEPPEMDGWTYFFDSGHMDPV